jgi:hypothetical protein
MDNFRERFEALAQRTEHVHQHTRLVARRRRWWRSIACGVGLLVGLLSLARTSQAADFACPAGDVACLIAAINTANANGEANTITLEAGTYTLTAVDNDTDGPNGLPSVTGVVTIKGAGADATILERDASAPAFRLGHVAATGNLTFDRLTLRGGFAGGSGIAGGSAGGILLNQGGTLTLTNSTLTTGGAGQPRATYGGCIFNQSGTVTLAQTTLTGCSATEGGGIENGTSGPSRLGGRVVLVKSTVERSDAPFGAGGIFTSGGTVTLLHSTLRGNGSEDSGGLNNEGGTVQITDSTIVGNFGDPVVGSGISNGGFMTILNSTIARNEGVTPGIRNGGHLLIVNSTIADNVLRGSGGIVTDGTGSTVLVNTILARNGPRSDCRGTVTSLGTNLIGDPTGCTITLHPSDLTGDPGLDTFTDDGTPGNGHVPLLPTSQAIDTGNTAACPLTDQLGHRRIGPCDIGAIRFLDHSDVRRHDKDPATATQASQ